MLDVVDVVTCHLWPGICKEHFGAARGRFQKISLLRHIHAQITGSLINDDRKSECTIPKTEKIRKIPKMCIPKLNKCNSPFNKITWIFSVICKYFFLVVR